MFNYEFIRIAFLVGILLSIIIPIIGTNLVFKRLSMSGDTLSHTSLAGVAIGIVAGFNPVLIAMLVSVVAALVVEFIRRRFEKYSELSLAIVMSVGVGITGLLSSYTAVSNFDSYLFGSMVAITQTELIMSIVLFFAVTIYFLIFYKDIMYILYSENSAKISGVPVSFVNISYTVLSALTIAIATKTIGALLVSSLIVIPVAASIQVSSSYKKTVINAIIISFISTVSGLFISYFAGLKPGGTIVLVAVSILILTMLINPIKKFINKKQKENNKT